MTQAQNIVEPNTHGLLNVQTSIQEVPRPSAPAQRFDTTKAYNEVEKAVETKLQNVPRYDPEEAPKLTKELADDIRNKMRSLNASRYKIFVVVSLYSQKGQGIRQCSRCFYDSETDYEVSYVYQKKEIICIATVYAVYLY